MSLFALNSMEHGIRGIHAPKQITVKRVDRAAPRKENIEEIVVVVEEAEDGSIIVQVSDSVSLVRLIPSP